MGKLHVFDAFKTDSAGVQYFIPQDDTAYEQGKPCFGFGMVRYWEGSIYSGDIYFDGKEYNKLGYGRQEFMRSLIGGVDAWRPVRKAFYVGEFDYRKTDWMYGNGVMYYVDLENRPVCFVKGHFEGDHLLGEWEGEFDYSNLSLGYTKEMEQSFDGWLDSLADHLKRAEKITSLENLWIGDSYFDLYTSEEYSGASFYPNFPQTINLNIGIGGTKFSDWLRYLPDIEGLKLSCPKRIFLNLGFNDIHSRHTPETILSNAKTLTAWLHAQFPEAKIYLNNIVKCPLYPEFYGLEEQTNALILANAEDMGVEIVDMRSLIEARSNEGHSFAPDNIHLNPFGYEAFTQKFKEIIKK